MLLNFITMINDQEIKTLIHEFNQNGSNYAKIKEILSELIYHFPAIGFEVYHEDIKGDFYLYVLDRLPKILSGYQPREGAQFKTFFYLVLRNQYFNFVKARKPEKKTLPIEEREIPVGERDEGNQADLEKISLLFASLPPKYRLILKLRCPEFLLPEDLFALGREFQKDPAELLKKLDLILKDIYRQEKKISLSAGRKDEDKSVSKKVGLATPRAIAEFLGVKANLVSKWLMEIRKIAEIQVGEFYVS